MTQPTLHILSQAPQQWQQLLAKNHACIADADMLLLLGNACSGCHTIQITLIQDIQAQYQLTTYMLHTDIEKYAITLAQLPINMTAISHHEWLALCHTARRVITW